MDICLRVLKESNKSRFDSYSVRNSVLVISYITFRDCRVHIFSDNLSRNSFIFTVLCRSVVWSLSSYCLRARDHCCDLCDVTLDCHSRDI